MTVSNPATSILAEFTSGVTTAFDMMIGVGVQKESDAVFFQYLDDKQSRALVNQATGRPVQSFQAVRIKDVEIAEEVGTFKATKLNVYVEGVEGTVVMLTSGLSTMWSQCVMTGLMGLMSDGVPNCDLSTRFTLWSKKGDQGLRPCFANIYIDGERISDNQMFEQLKDARSDRNKELVERIMRDSVSILSADLNGLPVDVVIDEPKALEPATDF